MAAHADVLSGAELELAELAGVLPAFGRAIGVAPARGHGERHRAARAIRALLERLAVGGPVVVVLDDVQRADPASADALALLLHRPAAARVLVALATRAGRAPGLERALAQAVRNGVAELLEHVRSTDAKLARWQDRLRGPGRPSEPAAAATRGPSTSSGTGSSRCPLSSARIGGACRRSSGRSCAVTRALPDRTPP